MTADALTDEVWEVREEWNEADASARASVRDTKPYVLRSGNGQAVYAADSMGRNEEKRDTNTIQTQINKHKNPKTAQNIKQTNIHRNTHAYTCIGDISLWKDYVEAKMI